MRLSDTMALGAALPPTCALTWELNWMLRQDGCNDVRFVSDLVTMEVFRISCVSSKVFVVMHAGGKDGDRLSSICTSLYRLALPVWR